MNYIFISPNFPEYYWQFCKSLRSKGIHVLGIGDAPYDSLHPETKSILVEYYRVNSLENYDEVYRAVGFFIGKYGRIDYIDSQNEYWLEMEAQLRLDFNIASGTRPKELKAMKYKSKMKSVYKKAGIPTARYQLIKKQQDLYDFVEEVGYPVVVKPDNGVGASDTHKLSNKKEVLKFLKNKTKGVSYIAEEFVYGHVETFDGITDSHKNILVCTSHVLLDSIMDSVNHHCDMGFYSQMVKGSDIETIGKKVVEAFDTTQKFFHFEFFRLEKDKAGLGKKGDLVGLEVNMRAPGAYIPDMMNYAYDCNVYDIYAQMIVNDSYQEELKQKYCIGYVGLRDHVSYVHHNQQIKMKYGEQIITYEPVPEALSEAMGNHVYLLKAKTEKEIKEMIQFIREKK
ncbi:acetyl-CoA carboxylase biotin carboxylase subunit family protein [Coprobacillus sp. AF33-1AC]|uniref:ATP-grasp domain-containing protein n=1 Tax=Coprobacillus sp. AF33-1AC TaxID=2292032 RepID=UPI000E4C353A|nr:ATP-grasp domain-containing protein [Coprobacillus sp. AF33-1AC]RHM59467.1 ATP-grasp domain-containing protein [Coprobacillus sp. AF33-1AC]